MIVVSDSTPLITLMKGIITHGFVKKTQKTPRAQIELAKKYRADFLKRHPIENKKKKGSR